MRLKSLEKREVEREEENVRDCRWRECKRRVREYIKDVRSRERQAKQDPKMVKRGEHERRSFRDRIERGKA